MSAIQEIKRLGILAGGGDLPRLLVDACRAHGIEPFVVAFKGQGDFGWLLDDISHEVIKIGKAGRVMSALRAHDVRDVVMLGAIAKPSVAALAPDMTGLKFLAKYGYSALGDDGLLSALRQFLEGEGFALHGAHRFMPEMVVPSGVLGVHGVDDYAGDIEVGMAAALALGAQDKGQSVVMRAGAVIAREGRSGTDAMIAGADDGRGAVLVKMCKPQQDRDLDLPTIGPATVRACLDQGFAGIAVHAGESFFVEREAAIALADEAGLFVIGVDAP